jgi:hypothetical protein
MADKPCAELKITWERFIEAALDRLSEKYPTISLNRTDNVRFVRNLSYEGECGMSETPEHVYIELEDVIYAKS